MFEQPTVFILGAGASWHYGYPTGEELVDKVIEKASQLQKYLTIPSNIDFRSPHYQAFEQFKLFLRQKDNLPLFIQKDFSINDDGLFDWKSVCQAFQSQKNLCEVLERKLKLIDPVVIDYFLRDNETLQELGKMLIALVLIECEFASNGGMVNTNKGATGKDNWVRFIIHKLLMPKYGENTVDILANKVDFVTFNYDTSLEYKLKQALSNTEALGDKYNDFFQDRFIHIYGSINNSNYSYLNTRDKYCERITFSPSIENLFDLFTQNFSPANAKEQCFSKLKATLDLSYQASQGIKTIGGHKHNGDDDVKKNAEKAQKLIEKAEFVYILGYGFDEQNSGEKILNLKEYLFQSRYKKIMFTNFENSERINRKAGMIFSQNPNMFIDGKNVVCGRVDDKIFSYQRSIKNVYEAFADDFDAI